MPILTEWVHMHVLLPRYSAGDTCTISASIMYLTVNLQVNENIRLRHMACHTGSDTLDRFIWVLSFLARNDFVVVPVDQLQYDDGVVVDRHTWGKVGALIRMACTAAVTA